MPWSEGYAASGLAAAAGNFPELVTPEFPTLVQDTAVLPEPGGGWYVLGAAEPMLVKGAAARWLVQELFPLLDGTRTAPQLAAALPAITLAPLEDVLQRLYLHGLLEAGDGVAAAPLAGQRQRRQARFFSRYLRVSGHHASGRDAESALHRGRALVAGAGALADQLARDLGTDGIGQIDRVTEVAQLPRPEPGRWLSGEATPLVLIVGGRRSPLVDACHERGLPYLPVDLEELVLGPLTIPGLSACPDCVAAQVSRQDPEGCPHPLRQQAMLARAVQVAVGWLTWLYPNPAPEQVEVWREPVAGSHGGEAAIIHRVVRIASCPRCATPEEWPTDNEPGSQAWLYHSSAAIKPWHVQQPSAQQAHISAEVAALTVRSLLPAVGPSAPSPPAADPHAARASVSLQTLLELLQRTFGLHLRLGGGGVNIARACPSAGNLGSPEVVVAAREVVSLAPGLYRFEKSLGELRVLPGDPGTPGAAVTLYVSGALTPLCSKYGPRGFFYALLDAGVVLHRLLLLARRSGLDAIVETSIEAEASAAYPRGTSDAVPLALVHLTVAKKSQDV